jgi:hypothetical protein
MFIVSAWPHGGAPEERKMIMSTRLYISLLRSLRTLCLPLSINISSLRDFSGVHKSCPKKQEVEPLLHRERSATRDTTWVDCSVDFTCH